MNLGDGYDDRIAALREGALSNFNILHPRNRRGQFRDKPDLVAMANRLNGGSSRSGSLSSRASRSAPLIGKEPRSRAPRVSVLTPSRRAPAAGSASPGVAGKIRRMKPGESVSFGTMKVERGKEGYFVKTPTGRAGPVKADAAVRQYGYSVGRGARSPGVARGKPPVTRISTDSQQEVFDVGGWLVRNADGGFMRTRPSQRHAAESWKFVPDKEWNVGGMSAGQLRGEMDKARGFESGEEKVKRAQTPGGSLSPGIETEDLSSKSVSELAAMIRNDWGPKVNFAAKPYLDAMGTLGSIRDSYGVERGDMIVAYFLSNAGGWRGPTAKRVKAELKKRMEGLREDWRRGA